MTSNMGLKIAYREFGDLLDEEVKLAACCLEIISSEKQAFCVNRG